MTSFKAQTTKIYNYNWSIFGPVTKSHVVLYLGRDETAFNEGRPTGRRPTADMKAKCRHEGIFITFSFFHEGIFITFLLFCLHR